MSDMDGVAEIEVLDDRGCVGSVMVHVVAASELARAPMAAPVDAHHAIAAVQEEKHLGIPVVATKRPAMVENNGLALAPVFVEDLDAVARCDRAHGLDSVAPVGRKDCAKLADCASATRGHALAATAKPLMKSRRCRSASQPAYHQNRWRSLNNSRLQ